MRALRAALALLLVAACAAAASRVVLPRLRCNFEKARVNGTSNILGGSHDAYERATLARQNAEVCRRCLALFPNDYEFQLLLAMNEYRLGEHERAEKSYRRAIELNERPEMYAYLAVAQLEHGKFEKARQNLYHATLFNITFVELVSEPLRSEIHEAVARRHDELERNSR